MYFSVQIHYKFVRCFINKIRYIKNIILNSFDITKSFELINVNWII